MRKISFTLLCFYSFLFYQGANAATGCGPGQLEKPLSEWGFKSAAKVAITSQGQVQVDGRKFRFDMDKGWCREDENGGCAFPLHLNEKSKVGSLILQAKSRDLMISESGGTNSLRIYPVAAPVKGAFSIVSLNSSVLNDQMLPVQNLPLHEVRSDIIVSARDADSGDISVIAENPKAKMNMKAYKGAARLSISCAGTEKFGI